MVNPDKSIDLFIAASNRITQFSDEIIEQTTGSKHLVSDIKKGRITQEEASRRIEKFVTTLQLTFSRAATEFICSKCSTS